jgi:hypothetical protein
MSIRNSAIYCVCILVLFLAISGCERRRETPELNEVVENVNEHCPQLLDEDTRIDGVEVIEGETLRYNYTLVNLPPGKIDTAQFRRAMWPGLVAGIKVSHYMKTLKEQKVVFQYMYHDNKGGKAYLFTIRPEDYKE